MATMIWITKLLFLATIALGIEELAPGFGPDLTIGGTSSAYTMNDPEGRNPTDESTERNQTPPIETDFRGGLERIRRANRNKTRIEPRVAFTLKGPARRLSQMIVNPKWEYTKNCEPICKVAGTMFPHLTKCNMFYKCSTDLEVELMSCPPGTRYAPIFKSCDNPERASNNYCKRQDRCP